MKAFVLAAVTACLAAGALAPAAAARTCEPPDYPGNGYFTSLSVSGVGCAKGASLARAYYRCRIAAGGEDGRCRRRVNGFSCRETRQSIPTEINAEVRCKQRRRSVVHSYQQNL